MVLKSSSQIETGGIVEQCPRLGLAGQQVAPRVFLGRNILECHDDARPVRCIRLQGAVDPHVDPAAVQPVVHGGGGEGCAAVPQLLQFLRIGGQRFIADDVGKVFGQLRQICGTQHVQRALVGAPDLDGLGAAFRPCGIGRKMGAEIGDTLGAPALENGFECAEILFPERNGHQIEKIAADGVIRRYRQALHGIPILYRRAPDAARSLSTLYNIP
jgi:hypothetical protein